MDTVTSLLRVRQGFVSEDGVSFVIPDEESGGENAQPYVHLYRVKGGVITTLALSFNSSTGTVRTLQGENPTQSRLTTSNADYFLPATAINYGWDPDSSASFAWKAIAILSDQSASDGLAEIVNADLIGLLRAAGFPYLFNGSTYDRQRGNESQSILASAARTATTDSPDQTNYNARGAHVIVDVTSITATPEITVKIQGKDPVSGNYYDILESDPITATGTTALKVYPGIAAVVNASANDILPRDWRVRVEHADADSITYSVGAMLVL